MNRGRWPRRLSLARVLTGLLSAALIATVAYAVSDRAGESPPAADAEATAIPARGGTYVEGGLTPPATLNPLLARTSSERDLATVLFAGLVRVDGSGQPLPDLAESWSVSDDDLSYQVRLRPGLRWHDGQPVTALDVVFTVRLIQDADFPGDPALSRFWRGVVVESSDERTVSFQLLEPFAAFPNYLTVPIVPRHVLSGVLPRDLAVAEFSRSPVGTGPFRVVSVDAERRSVTLEAFAAYHGDRPYLDRVEFRFYDDRERLLAALRDGEIHGTGALPLDQLLRPGALPAHTKIYAPGMSGLTALFFNLRSPLFANADVRRAVHLAVDRRAILDGVLHGQASIGTRPIPETSWSHLASPPLERDVQAAAELLAGAGWRDTDDDGVLDDGSLRLSFPLLVNADNPRRVVLAEELARQLSEVGIQAVVQPMSPDEVSAALASRQFSAAIFGWHTATGDPDCYQLWHSSQADDGLNFTGLRHPEIDQLLEEARQTSSLERRRELYVRFQEIFAEEAPAVVLYYSRYHFVVSDRVHGVEPVPLVQPSDRLRQITRWYVETAAEPDDGQAAGGG